MMSRFRISWSHRLQRKICYLLIGDDKPTFRLALSEGKVSLLASQDTGIWLLSYLNGLTCLRYSW